MAHKYLVINTGGTIAGQVASDDPEGVENRSAEAVGHLNEMLADTLNQIRDLWGVEVELETVEVTNVDSSDIVPADWVKVIDAIVANYNQYAGFIVTHGTNSMGYTAAALSFALTNLGKPVVVTGSQVPFGWPGSDALMNLENAVRIAAWPFERIRGVVCVFGSHIITGVRAKKSTEFDYDAFQSFSTASLGRIGRIIDLNPANLQRHHQYLIRSRPEAITANRLEVHKSFDARLLSFTEFPGMSPEMFMSLLRTLIDNKVDATRLKGVVFRAFGAGDVSTHLHECLRYLKEMRVPIVVTTQAPNGNSNFKVNVPGELLEKNGLAIPAWDMSIEAITTKLMWLLGQGVEYEDMSRQMLLDLHGEVNPKVEMV